jgi:hypothetical protein
VGIFIPDAAVIATGQSRDFAGFSFGVIQYSADFLPILNQRRFLAPKIRQFRHSRRLHLRHEGDAE